MQTRLACVKPFLKQDKISDKKSASNNFSSPIEHKRDAIIDGEFNKVPVLSGVTSEEGIMMVSLTRIKIWFEFPKS